MLDSTLDRVSRALDGLGAQVLGLLPALVAAAVLLLIGWLLARLVRGALRRVAGALGQLEALLRRHRVPTPRAAALAEGLARAGYWLVLAMFGVAAAEVLGLPGAGEALSTVGGALPGLVAAVLLVVAGYLGGGVLRHVLERSGAAGAARAAPVLQWTLVVAAALAALQQLGLEVGLLASLLTVLAASLGGAAALALGIGSARYVENAMAAREARQRWAPGQRLRVGEHEGLLIEVGATALVMDTARGRVVLPARETLLGPVEVLDDAESGAGDPSGR